MGGFIFVLPLSIALRRCGGRIIFSTLIFLSSFSTALIPLAAKTEAHLIILIRMIQGKILSLFILSFFSDKYNIHLIACKKYLTFILGMAFASSSPIVGCLSSSWAPESELGESPFVIKDCSKIFSKLNVDFEMMQYLWLSSLFLKNLRILKTIFN